MSNKVVISGICTSQLPKLDAKASEELLKRIKNGETELREEFLMGNIRLVLSMVQRFHTDKDIADDLFQVGMLGLIKALDNFDINMDVRFSTYAVPMILGEIRRFIRDSTALKVGRSLRDIAYRVMQARDKLEEGRESEVSLMEIAKEIDVPYKDVVCALDAIAEPVSIYESVYSDGDDSILVVDQLKCDKDEDDLLNSITLKDEINNLPEKEREILYLRYFKGDTQMEISKKLNISQAQVSRLEKSAIAHLRKAF
ncbi:MAG: sigma-70 family RNA polymerase sigma factor [Bacillota bacterium]|jgi:RNA polymerase sporulation-specific sigma factor|nr:sigma-70 family RNA polymerase sigma factor [Bacillota bacterium]HHU43174.1 sigma-70 family RNA polymerase sigma factor [Clostridiales bacterium]